MYTEKKGKKERERERERERECLAKILFCYFYFFTFTLFLSEGNTFYCIYHYHLTNGVFLSEIQSVRVLSLSRERGISSRDGESG